MSESPSDRRSPADQTAAEVRRPSAPTFGRFRLLGELGRGGHGVVLLAEDQTLGRRVALKLPQPELLLDGESRASFLHEARLAARLEHPAIVPLYEAGTLGQVCYLVTGYCPGPNLGVWLAKHAGGMAPSTAAAIVLTLAEAVDFAHRRGVVHCDIKPGNIVLDQLPGKTTGVAWLELARWGHFPRLTDFGVAQSLERSGAATRVSAGRGTPGYAAPELIDSSLGKVGKGVDIYALGAVLYELLTGKPPGRAPTDLVPSRPAAREAPRSPRKFRPESQRELESICHRCLQADVSRRYGTAAELGRALERYLHSATASTRGRNKPAGSDAVRQTPAGRFVVASLAAMVVLVLALGGHRVQDPTPVSHAAQAAPKLAESLRRAHLLADEVAAWQQDHTQDTAAMRRMRNRVAGRLAAFYEQALRNPEHHTLPLPEAARMHLQYTQLFRPPTDPRQMLRGLQSGERLLASASGAQRPVAAEWRMRAELQFRQAQFWGDHWQSFRQATALAKRAFETRSVVANDRDDYVFLSNVCRNIARWQRRNGSVADAWSWMAEGDACLRRIASREIEHPEVRLAAARNASVRGDLCRERADWEAARQAYQRELALAEGLLEQYGDSLTFRELRAGARLSLGRVAVRSIAQPGVAKHWLQQAVGDYRALAQATDTVEPRVQSALTLADAELSRLAQARGF